MQHKRLNRLLDFCNSKPNSIIFFLDVSCMALATASATLCWIDSSFSQKDSLEGWSDYIAIINMGSQKRFVDC